eukprot:gene7728-biopygen6345
MDVHHAKGPRPVRCRTHAHTARAQDVTIPPPPREQIATMGIESSLVQLPGCLIVSIPLKIWSTLMVPAVA